MKRVGVIGVFVVLAFLLLASVVSAQDATPESTPEATELAVPEATLPPGALLDFPGPGAYTVQVKQGDLPRSYGVYIPEAYATLGEPAPLVVVLHAAAGTGTLAEQHTGFDSLADENGFIVAYPDGINGFWNDGRPVDPRVDMTVSDTAYIAGVIAFLGTKLSLDPARVYLTGYSMGGMMAIRAGCELGDQIAAVASVASNMPEYAQPFCNSSPPLSMLFLVGTDDHSVPWVGQPGNGTGYMSATNSLSYWSDHNHCADDPVEIALDDANPQDGTRVIVSRHEVCDANTEVDLYGIYFGGHTWPGRPNPLGVDPGLVSRDIDGTAVIWEFFNQHSRETE